MSFDLTIKFSEFDTEHEIFATRAEAINFAKRIHREGYTTERDGKFAFYPIGSLSQMTVQESKEPVPERSLGHGL